MKSSFNFEKSVKSTNLKVQTTKKNHGNFQVTLRTTEHGKFLLLENK